MNASLPVVPWQFLVPLGALFAAPRLQPEERRNVIAHPASDVRLVRVSSMHDVDR